MKDAGTTAEGVKPSSSTPDPRWALVERIGASPQLKRSARLREVLHYLCQRSWNEGAEEIHEHEIGTMVFGRPANYDSAQDTIVRVQASQLRKRLEKYFLEDGAGEPLILEIPKGSYQPVLRPREPQEPQIVDRPASPPQAPSRITWALAILCVVLAATCGFLLHRQSQMVTVAPSGPTVQKFWSTFASRDAETSLVLADSAYAALQDALGRPIGLDEYVRRGYQQEFDRPDRPEELRALMRYLMSRRYTSLADVMFVRRVAQFGLLDPARTVVVYSRDQNLRAFQSGNHILIGSQRAVPWVSLFDRSLDFHINDKDADFHLKQDSARAQVAVENRRPRSGEPPRYVSPSRGPEGSGGFSLIASLPNLTGTGNVLILAGTDMSSTEAAGNLLTTERFLVDLVQRLPRKDWAKMPYFEALLRTWHVDSTNRDFEIVALHPH
jgi:hypothetical protein